VKKKTFFTLKAVFAVAFAAAFLSCATPDKAPQTLTLVHTNDVHSNVEVYPYVKGMADSIRAKGGFAAVISAGDEFDGKPFATLSKGFDIATVMNMTGYEMMVLGNHEQFDAVDFRSLAPKVKFAILAANIPADIQKQVLAKPYIVKKYGNTKVAFIGLTTRESGFDARWGDEAVSDMEKAREAASKEGATVFVAVVHLGVTGETPEYLSTYIADKCPWVAVILDGHDHVAHENGLWRDNGVLINETGEYGNNIGLVTLSIQNGQVLSKSARNLPIKGHEAESGITPDAQVSAFIAERNAENAKYLNEVLFTTPVPLKGARATSRCVEGNYGNLLCDALVWRTGADIAAIVGPGIRTDIDVGPVTREELDTSLYLNVAWAVFDITGENLWAILDKAVASYPKENNSFLQIGGVRYTFTPGESEGARIKSVTLANGTPVAKDGTIYKVATKSDCNWAIPGFEKGTQIPLDGAPGLYGMRFDAPHAEGKDYVMGTEALGDALVAYIREKGESVLTADIDGRIGAVQ